MRILATGINYIAEGIGYAFLFLAVLMILITLGHVIHDWIRAKLPKYDRWLYDEIRRENRKKRWF